MTYRKPQVSLGGVIRARRERLALSQEAFADLIKMHRAYYSSIERDVKMPTVRTLTRVAQGLGVRVSDLLREAGL
jgi:transcriptional regulator with XRE-family HTH domain